jgi:hypothetical protein
MATRVVMYPPGQARLRRTVDARLVHPVTDAVTADARRYVPVLTGRLRGTIRAEHLTGSGRVWFGNVAAGVDYHLYVEYGTSRMAAQPYMRPALFQARAV